LEQDFRIAQPLVAPMNSPTAFRRRRSAGA
jgi:hypothetical protein